MELLFSIVSGILRTKRKFYVLIYIAWIHHLEMLDYSFIYIMQGTVEIVGEEKLGEKICHLSELSRKDFSLTFGIMY